MAIVAVSGNDFLVTQGSTNVSRQFANNVAGGSLLVAFVSTSNTGVTITVSDDVHGSYTALTSSINGGLGTQLQIFYKYNATAGTRPTVTTAGITSGSTVITIVELSGAYSTINPYDGQSNNSTSGGSGFPSPGSITTTGNGIVMSYAEMYPAATPSAGTGYTLGVTTFHSSGYKGAVQYKNNATTGANNPAFGDASQSYWAAVGVAFKEAPPTSTSGTFTRKVIPTRQPPIGSPLDYDNPIFKELASFITFNGREKYLFGNTNLSRSGSGLIAQATTAGMGMSSNGGSNYFTSATGVKLVCAGVKFSILLTIKLNATGQTNTYAVFDRASSGTGTQNAILYGYTSNQFEFYSPGFSGSDPRTGSGITVADTLPHTIMYTYDGVTWSGFLDGVQVFSVARSFTVPVNDSTGIGAILNTTGANQLNATIINYATWTNGISASSASSITLNPWQLFAPTRKFLPTAPSPKSTFKKLKYHTRQPQYPVDLDYTNPITQAMIFHAPMTPAFGVRDLISDTFGTKTGLTGIQNTIHGQLPLFGASNYVDFTVPPTFDGNLPTTFAWIQQPMSMSGNGTILDIRAAVNSGSNDFLIYESTNDTNYYMAVGNRNGGSNAANFYTVTGPATNGKLDYYVLTVSNGINDASATLSHYTLWRNGVKLNPAAATTIFGAATQTGFRIGDLRTGGGAFPGAIGGVTIWQRILSDKEAYIMTTNPSSIYAPYRRYYPTAPTVAAPPAATYTRTRGFTAG